MTLVFGTEIAVIFGRLNYVPYYFLGLKSVVDRKYPQISIPVQIYAESPPGTQKSRHRFGILKFAINQTPIVGRQIPFSSHGHHIRDLRADFRSKSLILYFYMT